MADKEIKVKIKADADTSKLTALEHELDKLKSEKLELKVQAKTDELNTAKSELESLKSQLESIESVPPHLRVNVDDEGVENLKSEIASMERKVANLEVDVDMAELEQVKQEMKAIESDPIQISMDNQNAMDALSNIKDGFATIRQSASEIGQHLNDALSAQAKQDTNKRFLQNALQDAQKTESVMNNINKIVADLPGDDTALQGLLSSAVASEQSLANDDQLLKQMATSATDYFSAMSFYGKTASEAQQDMNNYLMTGQTTELELSPILKNHIEDLKEGKDIRERTLLLQQALNEEHWGGMGQDTQSLNNKMETFNGMLERGQYNLGSYLQTGAMGFMDLALNLDEASGGLLGMGIAVAGFASPLTEGLMGLGQMATGLKAIKDLDMIKHFKDLEIMTKLSAVAQYFHGVASATYGAIVGVLSGEISIATGAQMIWNAVMMANPIILVAVALLALIAILVYAYQNVDWFREMVDNAWASVTQFAGVLWNSLVSAFNYASSVISNFTNSLGLNSQNWIQAILGFILFLPTLPMRLSVALANAIANVLGFKGNFVNHITSSAKNAVTGFTNAIRGIGTALKSCLDWCVSMVMSHPLVQKLIWLGNKASEVFSAIGLGQSSPGKIVKAMRQELDWTSDVVKGSDLPEMTGALGTAMTDNFSPSLDANFSLNGEILTSATNTNNPENTGGGIIINIGSVDNEERVNEIVDAVRRALSWDNKTAGRTV